MCKFLRIFGSREALEFFSASFLETGVVFTSELLMHFSEYANDTELADGSKNSNSIISIRHYIEAQLLQKTETETERHLNIPYMTQMGLD